MINYDKYELEDFLQDDSFISWALKSADAHAVFWDDWLLAHPDRRVIAEQARAIVLSIEVKPINEPLTDRETEQMINYIQAQVFTPDSPPVTGTVKMYRTLWFKIAATLLVICAVTLLLYHEVSLKGIGRQLPDEFISFNNHTKESALVRMSDGSLAVLTPGSSIKYPKLFNTGTRQVYLEGQAFFEVHKNPAKPFLVHSQDMVARVLGTSFTVKAFHQSKEFKVIVNTGRVMVYQDLNKKEQQGKKNQVILIPNEEVTYQRQNAEFKKTILATPLMLSKEIAKKEFTFHDAPLSEIIKKLNEAYGVNIEYDEKRLGNEILTASLSDRPLDEKVNIICKAINARCEITEGHIKIVGGNVNPETHSNL